MTGRDQRVANAHPDADIVVCRPHCTFTTAMIADGRLTAVELHRLPSR
ncbi:hypothetical protein [Frankia sp. Cr1]|nr:hypothetical protein [Frankia sp. Cr1]